MSAGIRALKIASAVSAYEKGGRVLMSGIRSAAKGAYGAVRGGATVGSEVAKGMGASPLAGGVIGGGTVVGGSVIGAKALNNKRRRWMYQHNFGRY